MRVRVRVRVRVRAHLLNHLLLVTGGVAILIVHMATGCE